MKKDASITWDEWLSQYEAILSKNGYHKYFQKHKNEDFCYWKIVKENDKPIYQIGVLFYDFRKYDKDERIGTMYECMILGDDGRIDMVVSKEIDFTEFELMAKKFYDAMREYTLKITDTNADQNLGQ